VSGQEAKASQLPFGPCHLPHSPGYGPGGSFCRLLKETEMFKSILVHVDPSQVGVQRMEAAAALAGAFEAHLTGLYVIPPARAPLDAPGMAAIGSLASARTERQEESPFRARRDKARRTFEAYVRQAGIDSTWHDVEGPVSAVVSVCARLSDLVVVGQTPPSPSEASVVPNVAAEVALESGRPTLVIPYAGRWKHFAKRVMVAWNGSRECARAAHDALPFMHRAEAVTALTVLDKEEIEKSSVHLLGIHIGDYLERHGIHAHWQRETTNRAVGEELLSRLADSSCDLLVMGAYGHSRLRQFIFGGATRYLLDHMTTPVVMTH